MSHIRLENVSKYYKSEETVSVGMKRINLELALGEFVAVTGESGSGKSTLLNVISGLDTYEDGEFFLFGEETSHYTIADWERYRGTYIGFVFQNYNIIDAYTVLQNVLLALEIQGYDRKHRRKRALELIDKVGLTSHKHHKASKLSGGQKQRAVIARALAKDCPVIVADEPTGNLDSESAKQVMQVLHDISKDKLIVVVTHDYDQVKEYATRKIKMHDGEIVEDKKIRPTQNVVATEPIKPKKLQPLTLLRFALRNLFSTPKKLIFMMLMQILVIAIFTIVYTNQMGNIREIGLEQSSVFPSVPETRVLIEKRDGSAFSSTELSALASNRHVRLVHEHGVNFYNQSRLFIQSVDGFGYGMVSGTDTAERLSGNEIEGRLPEALNEIVVSAYYQSFQVGDTVRIAMGSYWFWGPDDEQEDTSIGTFTVVGIDKRDRQIIYFSEAFLAQPDLIEDMVDINKRNETRYAIMGNMTIEYDERTYFMGRNYGPAQAYDLIVQGCSPSDDGLQYIEFTTSTLFGTVLTHGGHYTIGYCDPEYDYGYMTMRADIFDDMIDGLLEQVEHEYLILRRNLVSLSVDGYYGGNQLIRTLDVETYKVYYPANISSPLRDFLVFFASLLALVFLTLFGLFLYSIVHAVTRNVMNARKKDFAIFRSIGANQSMLARLVILEQVLMSMTGFVITIIVLNILANNITYIGTTIQYMETRDYVILFTAFILFGAWLGLRFNKRVFKQSVIETLTASREE